MYSRQNIYVLDLWKHGPYWVVIMKQMQMVLGTLLALVLCYGAVLASGGGERNDTAGIEPVIAGGAVVSQSIINATNKTFEEPDPLLGRTATPHIPAPVQQASGGEGGGGSSSSPAPTATPAANVTANVTATPTGTATTAPTGEGSSTPSPTSTPTSTLIVDVTPTTTPPAPTPTPTWTIAYHHDYEKNAFQYVIPDWGRDTAHIIVEFDLRTTYTSDEALLRGAGDLGEMVYDELRSSPAGQRGNVSVSGFKTFDGRRIDSSRELIVERLTFFYGYEDRMACSLTEMDGLTGAGFSEPRGILKYRQMWWMTMQHTFPPGPIYYKLALYVYETAPDRMPNLPEPIPTAIPMPGRGSPMDPLPSWVNASQVGERTPSPTPTPPAEPTLEITAEPTPVETPEVTHEVFLEAGIGASSGMTVEEPTPAEGENETA